MINLIHPANFRDLGGIPGADGRKVVPMRLLRCGEVTGLSGDEVAVLTDHYSVCRILDLRTATEIHDRPDIEIPGAEHFHINFEEGNVGPTGVPQNITDLADASEVHPFMRRMYAKFITSPVTRGGLKSFIAHLLEVPQGAVLFHCFAGKDRTGIAAAVTLSLLGASREDIFADYMETNIQRRETNEATLQYLAEQNIPDETLRILEVGLYVDASYLQKAFDTAEKEYGSFDSFICSGIGISESERNKLRQMYLI